MIPCCAEHCGRNHPRPTSGESGAAMSRGLTMKYLYVGMLLLCAIAGIYLHARNKNSDFFGGLMWAVIPWGFFLVFCNLLLSLTAPPTSSWSSARLLPTIALTKGYRIYSGVSPI